MNRASLLSSVKENLLRRGGFGIYFDLLIRHTKSWKLDAERCFSHLVELVLHPLALAVTVTGTVRNSPAAIGEASAESQVSGAELVEGLPAATNQSATQATMKAPNSSSRVDVDMGKDCPRNHGKLQEGT